MGWLVEATDVDPACCRLTNANASRNGVAGQVTTRKLLWGEERCEGEEEVAAEEGGRDDSIVGAAAPQLVVMADVVYNDRSTEALVRTLRGMLLRRLGECDDHSEEGDDGEVVMVVVHAWGDRGLGEEGFLGERLGDVAGGASCAVTVMRQDAPPDSCLPGDIDQGVSVLRVQRRPRARRGTATSMVEPATTTAAAPSASTTAVAPAPCAVS